MGVDCNKNSHSAIDYTKLRAIERIEGILEGIKKDYLKVVDVQYFQTLNSRQGMSIITEPQDPRDRC